MRMMKLHTNKVLVNIEKSDFSVCFINHFLIPKSWASQVLHQHCAASKSLFAYLVCVECTYMFLLLECMNLEWFCVLFVGSY